MNYILADFVVRIKVASKGHLKSVKVIKTKLVLKILSLIYKLGIIRGFFVLKKENFILVLLKYKGSRGAFYDISLVSKPGRRAFWKNKYLASKYTEKSFSGFYIISTSKGLCTNNDVLFGSNMSGEILLKVKV